MNPTSDSASSASVGRVLASDATKADKIRRLDELGMSRANIARAIGVRYQYVRNVLVDDERRRTALAKERASGPSRAAPAQAGPHSGVREASPAVYAGNARVQAGSKNEGAAAAESDFAPDDPRVPVWRTLNGGGMLELPGKFLAALGVEDGDRVCLKLDANGLRIMNRDAALTHAQELASRYAVDGDSAVDELIVGRRREAREEEAESERLRD